MCFICFFIVNSTYNSPAFTTLYFKLIFICFKYGNTCITIVQLFVDVLLQVRGQSLVYFKNHGVVSQEMVTCAISHARNLHLIAYYTCDKFHVSVTGVGFRWRLVGDMTGWLGSSVVVSHGQLKALGSSPGRATIFHLLHQGLVVYHCDLLEG